MNARDRSVARVAFAFAVAACTAWTAVAPARAGVANPASVCALALGGRVVLEADATDPQVFLWDSRVRLVDYAAGQWGDTRAIFAHTVLAEPGTQATIVACVPAAAHPRYATADEDAIGIKIMNGPYRGRYGWVLSSDIHVARPNGESAVLGEPRP